MWAMMSMSAGEQFGGWHVGRAGRECIGSEYIGNKSVHIYSYIRFCSIFLQMA
jgi:hypothetical protein